MAHRQRLYTLGLSVDPNPTNTGLVWWNNEDPIKWVDLSPLEQPASYPNWVRMSLAIWRVILRDKPDWVACEGTYIGKNKKVAADIIGIVRNTATYSIFRGIPYFEPGTSQIDNLTGVQHTGRKTGNLTLAELVLQEKISQDIADAFACGMAGKVLYDEYKLRNLDDERLSLLE